MSRNVFIPGRAWWEDEDVDGPVDLVPLRCADDLDAWLELAYGHDFVITQDQPGRLRAQHRYAQRFVLTSCFGVVAG